MFDLGANDVLAPAFEGGAKTFESEVVTFRAAAGKDDFFALNPEGLGNFFSGVLEGLVGVDSEAVEAGGVAEVTLEVGLHSPEDTITEACGCGIIEVVERHDLTLVGKA